MITYVFQLRPPQGGDTYSDPSIPNMGIYGTYVISNIITDRGKISIVYMTANCSGGNCVSEEDVVLLRKWKLLFSSGIEAVVMSNKLENRIRVLNKPELRRCRDLIRKIVPESTVILYGSRARGNADPESDYDLLVLVKGHVNWQLEERIREELYPLELETGITFSLVVFSEEDWNTPLYRAMPFSRNVRQEGIIL